MYNYIFDKMKRKRTRNDEQKEQAVQTGLQSSLPQAQSKRTTSSGSRIEVNGLEHTPEKPTASNITTPIKSSSIANNADRSARRRSSRRIVEAQATGNASEDEEREREDSLARKIWDGGDVQDDDGEEEEEEAEGGATDGDEEIQSNGNREEEEVELNGDEQTSGVKSRGKQKAAPKRGRVGRPKGSKNKRDNTPPLHELAPYETYFYQNRPGVEKNRTSNNTISSLSLLSHEDYISKIESWKDPHEAELSFLHSLHGRSFDQWAFELSEEFNICLYGYGSKREVVLDFAEYLSLTFEREETSKNNKIVVVNGYNASLTVRDVLTTVASAIPALSSAVKNHNMRLGSQPSDMLNTIINHLPNRTTDDHPAETQSDPTNSQTFHLTLLIPSIDAPPLRRLATQSILSQLAAHPSISIMVTADTPNFPLLWDSNTRSQFNWVFHDATTFQPFDLEVSGGAGPGGVVDEVNTLLGRSGRKMHGREGLMFVLRSLTQNARALYALLVAELIASEEEEKGDGADDTDDDLDRVENNEDEQDEDFEAALTGSGVDTIGSKRKQANNDGNIRTTISYRTLYQKAVSQFIATNEVTFRSLLKEFYDHQMIFDKKDALGTDLLGVPFRREEMEVLLGELTIEGD